MTREELLNMHTETCYAAKETMKKKNHDYTSNSPDPFANFRASEIVGVDPVKGILMRLTDKLKRIQTFVEKETLAVEGEGVFDAIEDGINYLILAKGLIMEKQGKKDGSGIIKWGKI